MTGQACLAYLNSKVTNVDEDMQNYIRDVLVQNVADFESPEDIVEAIGSLLEEVDASQDNSSILDVCTGLFDIIKGANNKMSPTKSKLLSAPVNLGDLSENMKVRTCDDSSIWMRNKDHNKLIKYEEDFKKKIKPNASSNSLVDDNCTASVSQQINKRDVVSDSDGRVKDIRLENFDVSFGSKVLLEGANLSLIYGRRYGLIGRNGLGKTTLLKLLSSGDLKIPSHISILHVEQEVVGDDTLAVDSVLEADAVRENLLSEEKRLRLDSSGGEARLNEIFAELVAIEADKAPAKAAAILHGLGFSTEMQKMQTRQFSGGWRMRLALARALFARPDLLLLDEPSNMLDMKAIIWLENYLQGWPSTLLLVSHDCAFLNAVVSDILFLHQRKLEYYRGDYDMFCRTREEKLLNAFREYESQMAEREHIQKFIDKFRYSAARAALVQSRIKMLERMPKVEAPEKDTEVQLKFPPVELKMSPPILQLDEVSFTYPGTSRVILKNICVNAGSDSRVCVVGDNGQGKSTLLKLLLGDLSPSSGMRHANRNLRLGFFSQHFVDQLDMDQTALEFMADKFPGQQVEVYRSQLGSFGVSNDLALRPIRLLSGGQKSRVALAIIAANRPNFLILDEPTNHLDVQTIAALGVALNKFNGGVVLVSHDERLIKLICTELWLCKDGTIQSVEGGIERYRRMVEKELELAAQ